MATNQNPEIEGLIQNLKDLFDDIEDAQPDILGSLREVQAIRHSILQHEAVRLERKLGAEHPRVRQLKARLRQTPAIVNSLDVEIEEAQIKVPVVSEGEALVHGRVIDERGRGISGLIVFAENDQGEAVRFVGSAETDTSGYFALRLDPETIARLAEINGGGTFIAVRTREDKPAHREREPINISEGQTVAIDIELKRDDLRPRGIVIPEPSRTPTPDNWLARGVVIRERSRIPCENYRIEAYDKDRYSPDDRLDDNNNPARTDRSGYFEIWFSRGQFTRRARGERRPDIYLKVYDQEGNEVRNLKEEHRVRRGASNGEFFLIEVSEEDEDTSAAE